MLQKKMNSCSCSWSLMSVSTALHNIIYITENTMISSRFLATLCQPWIPVQAKNVRVLQTPAQFYTTLQVCFHLYLKIPPSC